MAASTAGDDEPTVFRRIALGGAFPRVALRDLAGLESALEPQLGAPQVVAFLRLDQEDSRLLLADLVSLGADREGPQPIVSIIGMHGGDWASHAKGLPRRVTIRLADESIAEQLGLIVLPSLALIDARGRLSRAYVLYDTELTRRLRADLEFLAGGGDESSSEAQLLQRRFDELQRNAAALEGRGRLDEALELSHQLLVLGLSRGRVLADRGRTYFLLGDMEAATIDLRESLELEDMVSVRTWLGRALARSGRHDEALTMLQGVLELTPQKAVVHRELARIFKQRGDIDLALEQIKKAIAQAASRSGRARP